MNMSRKFEWNLWWALFHKTIQQYVSVRCDLLIHARAVIFTYSLQRVSSGRFEGPRSHRRKWSEECGERCLAGSFVCRQLSYTRLMFRCYFSMQCGFFLISLCYFVALCTWRCFLWLFLQYIGKKWFIIFQGIYKQSLSVSINMGSLFWYYSSHRTIRLQKSKTLIASPT